MFKKILFATTFLVILVLFFLPIPRSEEEMQDFITKSQIEYPLPDETIGRPVSVQDRTGIRTEKALRKSGEFLEKKLKINKIKGEFYWDSWKGQKLKVIRGRYYITDQPLASTTFISEDNDGVILIYNGKIGSLNLCGRLGSHDMRSSRYIEMRSGLDGAVEVIKGNTVSFYPHGFADSFCDEPHFLIPTRIQYKLSAYSWMKQRLFTD